MTPEQANTLGKIEQKLDDMCATNRTEHREIKDQISKNLKLVQDKFTSQSEMKETRMIECQKLFDNRPKMGLFLWLMGGVFTVLMFIGGLTMNLDNKVDTHIERAKHAFHQITGEDYVPPSEFGKK